ncbi:hypothetical protein CCR75_000200 [Bremia lactucae]|uniref:Tetratricopeptide repeat protein 37 n=1 Tax=Bremia lactucae TaxID=4779 RepID=A0A976IAY4_BRELC|nr:hypothetical protein CCR75_000204 [Bremia lactucae]TDH65097.1 hypothetical protein CCR75_000200 [Bremia lactucae]
MSTAMLKKMLLDAASALKAERFQEAQDAGRRVTQLDSNNFQAFMCIGIASLHLQQWANCEDACRRAADLKPDMPTPWKYLVDLFEAKNDYTSKLEPLQKLVDINFRSKKPKKCQKWVAEVARTAMKLNLLPKAFDSWYLLVGEQTRNLAQLSLENTPNNELPTPLSIWLDMLDLLQRPGFSLSECSGTLSMTALSHQFFAVVFRINLTAQNEEICAFRQRIDVSMAFFMRFHLDDLKSSKEKSDALKTVDSLAISIVERFPESKTAAEYLLLRSEDQDTHALSDLIMLSLAALMIEKSKEIAKCLSASYPNSPMVLVFQAIECLHVGDTNQAQEKFVKALAGYASSPFQECTLCIRVHVELASIALAARDIEGCLKRLALAKKIMADKMKLLGTGSPLPAVYSEVKVEFMTAKAHEYSAHFTAALKHYRKVIGSDDVGFKIKAVIAAAELLAMMDRPQEAIHIIDSLLLSEVENEEFSAALLCTLGWLHYKLGKLEQAQELLEENASKISPGDVLAKGQALKRLAIVYWHCGGSLQTMKTGCFSHLLQAAKLTPSDAEIFSWLGKWYQEIAKDNLRAEKCFLKALSLSSTNELAGLALSSLYDLQDKYETNVELWKRMTQNQETAPTWALLRLAQHIVDQNDEAAVGKLHLVLRNDPLNARHWVIMAHVYHHFSKHVSAQRSYVKAIELGENSWSVRCELARIEGSMFLFDDALKRIKPVVVGESSDDEPDVTVAAMIYCDLLFQQAKYLCVEGLYGRAAENLKEASATIKSLPSTSSFAHSVEACKLMGDIHCFAFYLTPNSFLSEGSTWVEFISAGRKAYEAGVLLAAKRENETTDGSDAVTAELYYDIGLGFWYESQALSNIRGIFRSAFSGETELDTETAIAKLTMKASTNFKLALKKDPSCALAWNGLALVSKNVLVKQFCWARAIQSGNSDASWANLGMFYLSQADAVPTAASLAQKSFLHLQSINSSNPAMWSGYAMLARRQANSPTQQRKTIEAFDCALQTGMHLDALLGLSMALLDDGATVGDLVTKAPEHKSELVLFYLKKYLERDPYNGRAWHALGVVQYRLKLYKEASVSYTRALSLTKSSEELKWDMLVTSFGELSSKRQDDKADEIELLRKISVKIKKLDGEESAIQTIVQAQLLHRQSKGDEAMKLLQAKLLHDEFQFSQADIIAVIGLSMASMLMEKFASQATSLAMACKNRLLLSINQAKSLFTTRDYENLRVVELYERSIGDENSNLTRLQALLQITDNTNSSTLWTRLGLATIDSEGFQMSRCLTQLMRSNAKTVPFCDESVERNYFNALLGLLKANSLGEDGFCLDAQKLIRAQPWNPHAYILAGTSILKRSNLAAKIDSHDITLRQLLRLLQIGLLNARGNEFCVAQLYLLISYCYVMLGEQAEAIANSTQALNRIEAGKEKATVNETVNTDLLEARLLSISNPNKAIKKYLNIIKSVSAAAAPCSNRIFPILIELGGHYEQWQLSNAAITVWKFLASITSTKSARSTADKNESSASTCLSSDGYLATCFFANLRLALVHGKRNQLKSARKHIKVAQALAETGEDLRPSTVAAFVESIFSN